MHGKLYHREVAHFADGTLPSHVLGLSIMLVHKTSLISRCEKRQTYVTAEAKFVFAMIVVDLGNCINTANILIDFFKYFINLNISSNILKKYKAFAVKNSAKIK